MADTEPPQQEAPPAAPVSPKSPKSAKLASDLASFEAASGRGADPVTAATDGHVDHAPTVPPEEPQE